LWTAPDCYIEAGFKRAKNEPLEKRSAAAGVRGGVRGTE